eukprot:scaffold32814_cov68-Phaeocystis_antarctica.AAC.6
MASADEVGRAGRSHRLGARTAAATTPRARRRAYATCTAKLAHYCARDGALLRDDSGNYLGGTKYT